MQVRQYPFLSLCLLSLMVFTASIISFIYFDKPLAVIFHLQLTSQWYNIANLITQAGLGGTYVIGLGILFALSFWIRSLAPWRSQIQYCWLTVCIAGLSCDLIKILCGRARPNEWFKHQHYGFYGWSTHSQFWSFPSGHTTVFIALMVAITQLYPRYRWSCLLAGISIAATRVILNKHYLSDVLVGAYLGCCSAYFIAKFTNLTQGNTFSQHFAKV